jgi:ATPase family associated with various cellular activities (AAA)
MPETTPMAAAIDRQTARAERMRREAALMAGRLARHLAAGPAEGMLPHSRAFLASMHDAYGTPSTPDDDVHPLDRLAAALALGPMEVDAIVLAAMADEHEGYSSILRSLNPRNEPCATAGLAAQLLCTDGSDRIVLRKAFEDGAAVRAGVITLTGDCPFFERSITLADGLASVFCGQDVYPATVRAQEWHAASCGLDEWLEAPDVTTVRRALAANQPALVFVVGDSESIATARAVALTAAGRRKWAAFEFGPALPAHADRTALVHALARGAVPIFTMSAGEGPAPISLPRLDSFPGPAIVCARRGAAVPLKGRAVIALDISPLTASAREHMWRETLPELSEHAPTLAARYAIEPSAAAEIAADLRVRSRLHGEAIDLRGVALGVRVRSNLPLWAGLKVVRPTARWEQLVLRPDRKALLAEAISRLMHQHVVLERWKFLSGRPGARGVRVLLSGPPGTGKTLSAEVMAASLGVDLLVVDISRVVSKWIGETEKHLSQAFDAAERAQAILLFDEADALFGKRTEVSDAHDRYANLETAYLLSRLERFDGLAVLSTNLKQNIDPAFLRRVEFAIDFDEPTAAEREALWRCHLPPEAPIAPDVDLRELAAFYPIVGGLIKNASVSAGFLAAAAGTSIGRHHLVGAIRREYDKSAKAFPGVPWGLVPA